MIARRMLAMLVLMSAAPAQQVTARKAAANAETWTGSPSAWPEHKVRRFLAESPWAHTVWIQVPSDYSSNGRRQILSQEFIVRWASSPLVKEALARFETKDQIDALADLSARYTVVAVAVVQRQFGHRDLTGQWGPEQLIDRLKGAARQVGRLECGGETISSISAQRGNSAEGAVFLFMFPKPLHFENACEELGFTGGMPGMAMTRRTDVRARFGWIDLQASR